MSTVYVQPCFIGCASCRKSQWSFSLVSVWSVFIGFDLRHTFSGCAVWNALSSAELICQSAACCASAAFSLSPNTTSVSSPSENECPR